MSERSIFLAAMDISDLAQRAAYLDQACGQDPKLRQHLDELIAAQAKLSGFLAKPHEAIDLTAEMTPISERPGTLIGPYKLLQQIGEGGFGVVYMAEQMRPVRRKVALKIIKPGMDTREVVARFESERQALALMDHPNIAKVLDGGTTESGRLYFVMELVKGIPLTQFCDDNKLDMRQRLALFATVCKAIQHAHHKGVIHRDIKPSNVMVTLHDSQPVPKVIDFGVSKAIAQQLTEKTMFTAYGQMIGTPAYMSPEQAEMSGLDIDTRSDVYSLGVLLYELLTGSTPLEAKSLRGKAYAELQRMIREDEPPRPSMRVSTRGEATALIAAQRSTGPRELGALLRGELDWIVMKALDKSRDRRYESANNFAADVERFLKHEAVEACPPSAIYRVRKFIRRNRVACTTGSLIAISLIGGLMLSTMATRDALYQRGLAEEALRVASADRQAAERAQKNTVVALQDAERERDVAEKAKQEESRQRQLAEEREVESKEARMAELEQRKSAELERDKARALNDELQTRKEQQRRSLYAAQMNLIQKAWESNNIMRVRELLNAVRPQLGEQDLRGFEWHYWMRMLHGEEALIQLPIQNTERVVSAAFSRDCEFLATVVDRSSMRRGGELLLGNQLALKIWNARTGKLIVESKLDLVIDASLPKNSFGNHFATVDLVHVNSEEVAVVLSVSQRGFGTVTSPAKARLQVFRTNTGEQRLSKEAEFYIGGSAFVFSEDGSRFATLLKEPFVQVCSADTGEEVGRVAVPPNEGGVRLLEFIALSPDGKKLAVKPGRRVSVDLLTGVTIVELESDNKVTTPPVTAHRLQFSPDGKQLATIVFDPQKLEPHASLFDATTGSELGKLTNTDTVSSGAMDKINLVRPISFSPIGNWMALTSGTQSGIVAVQLWNLTTNKPSPKFQGFDSNPLSIAFSADGAQLVSVHENGNVLFWSIPPSSQNVEASRALPTRRDEITSPDGRWVVSSNVQLTHKTNESSTASPSPFGTEMLVKDSFGKIANRVLPIAPRTALPKFSPNSAYILAYGYDPKLELADTGELKVWEVATGRQTIAIRMSSTETTDSSTFGGMSDTARTTRTFRKICFSPNGQQLAVAEREDSTQSKFILHVWDLNTGKQLLPGPGNNKFEFRCNELEFSKDGDLLVGHTSYLRTGQFPQLVTGSTRAFNFRSEIQVWSLPKAKLLFEESNAVTARLNATGSRISAFVRNGNDIRISAPTVVVWDILSSQEACRFTIPINRPVNGYDLSDDGSRMAIASGNDLLIYNVDAGKELFVLQGHAGSIREMTFNANNSRIASSATIGNSGTMDGPRTETRETKVWDGVTGQELLSLGTFDSLSTDRIFIGDGDLKFMPTSLLANADHKWDASPLTAETEAEELVHWLTSNRNDRLATLDQIKELLDSDATVTQEVRSLAMKLVRERRSFDVLVNHVSSILNSPELPRIEYKLALALIKEANEKSDSNFEYAYLEGLAHYRLGDFAAALSASLSSLVRIKTTSRSALAEDFTVLAMAQFSIGQRDSAMKSLDESRMVASKDERAWQKLLAEAEGKMAVEKADSDPDRWIGRRFMPREMARISNESGARVFDWSMPFFITRVDGDRLGFGKKFVARTDVVPLEDAIPYYTSGLLSRKEYVNYTMLNSRGVTWRIMGEPDKAIADYSDAIRGFSTESVYYSNRARVWAYDRKEYDKALTDLDVAIRMLPNKSEYYELRGDVLCRMGRLDEALKSFEAAISLDATLGHIYGTRAYAWSANGDRAKMLADLDEGIRRSPSDDYTWNCRAWLLATSPVDEHRNGPLAVAAATKACELSAWKEPRNLDALAASYAEMGDFTEAIKWQEKALSMCTKQYQAEYESRLKLYREGKPYREPVIASPNPK